MSDKLNQGLIEEHFGRIQGVAGASDNPTLEQYGYRNRKFIVAKLELIQVTKRNTRRCVQGRHPRRRKFTKKAQEGLPVILHILK